jgi:hypothetical protein
MNIIFANSTDQSIVPYATMLILRDNIQHHLQAGRVTPGYPLLHGLADPTSVGRDPLPAHPLWEEVSLALAGLRQHKISDLAVSTQTRALLTGVRDVPMVRATVLARLTGWETPFQLCTGSTLTLDSLFGQFRAGIEQLTESGNSRGYIHVLTPSVLEARWAEGLDQRLHRRPH